VPVAIEGHAKNISIIFHDNLSPEIIIPVNPKIKYLFGLSEYHSKQIKQTFPQFTTNFINYGVKDPQIEIKKVKNSLYISEE
jgi:hypothetical protein